MTLPKGEKSQGQTDQRILGLSYTKFEKEFGFKPDDKVEQRYFATHGRRLTNEKIRARAERQDKILKASAAKRSE